MEDIQELQVIFVTESGRMKMIQLKGIPNGKYLFEKDAKEYDFIYIEAMNGKWYAKCNEPAFFKNSIGKVTHSVELFDCMVLRVYRNHHVFVLYIQKISCNASRFCNYFLIGDETLKIGRTEENDICYKNKMVSRNHALLSFFHQRWFIEDTDSANHVFVNGVCVKKKELFIGDIIYIMGLRIVIGYGYISINQQAVINPDKLKKARKYKSNVEVFEREISEISLYNRFPRNRLPMNVKDISIEAPPMSMNNMDMPMILRMGSSLVMGGSAVMMGNITMLLSSLMFPFLRQRFSDKERKEYEEKRIKVYTKYLVDKKIEIENEIKREELILNKNFPDMEKILQYPFSEHSLWERRKNDDDFLFIRVGYGTQTLLAKINYPERRLDLNEDELENKMYQLAEFPYQLDNVPITISLIEHYICGILGKRDDILSFVSSLLQQLSILYAYDEVKIIFLTGKSELQQLEFIKFLPHIWNDQMNIRFLAINPMDTYSISEYLKRDLADQFGRKRELNDILKQHPYYIIVALDKKIYDSMEILKDIVQEEWNQGVSILAAFDDLPKECMVLFRLNENGKHSLIYVNQIEKEDKIFYFDTYEEQMSVKSMRAVANKRLKMVSQKYSLPKIVTFLEMFGIGKVEHLNPLKRWEENNPVKSLAVPIGIATDGQLFELDLHEKFQGPHGLVAGMTGSGKSEFIITYILSLAVNYHPNEVAFVLIDYKGGGLAGAFEDKERGIRLPHLAGTITNLDGSEIQRSLISIQSELLRRQRIFQETKSVINEGTIDIYLYQKLYREKKVSEPLPHLFIISDEFAELKHQEKEFMEQLISAARIGRSLGIHLILATQKPSGVVDDQIRSNSKFRVCLKVQTKADSIDMLQKPNAAELNETGRFYLQVGYNEFFALGQSAWCGADYEPQDNLVVKRNDSVQVIGTTGQVILEVKQEEKKEKAKVKQIVAVVRMLSELAMREKIKPYSLWEEALPFNISTQKIIDKYSFYKRDFICIPIGCVDDPAKQIQYPFIFDIQKCQNLLIAGDSGSGKSILLQTFLYMLVKYYSPEEVNFYTIDFSGKMLNIFEGVPHCGANLDEDTEADISRFLQMVEDMILERKRAFAEKGVTNFEHYVTMDKIPLVLILIDNISGLMELKKGDDYYRKIGTLMRDGVSYGIKFIITAVNLNDFNLRIRQNASSRLAFRMIDKYAMGGMLECSCKYIPPRNSGRGLCVMEGFPLEFQAAMYGAGMNEQERIEHLKNELKEIADQYSGIKCKRVFLKITKDETYQDFCRDILPKRIPLGYLLSDLKKVSMPFKQLSSISVYFGNSLGIAPVLGNFLYASVREQMDVIIIKKRKNSIFDGDREQNLTQTAQIMDTQEGTDNILSQMLFQRIGEGTDYAREFCLAHGIYESKEKRSTEENECIIRYIKEKLNPILVLFESMVEFCRCIDKKFMSKYGVLFSNASKYNIFFLGCYYPDELADFSKNNVQHWFNRERFILLFGGQYQKQKLVDLPRDIKMEKKLDKYNNFIMQYKSNIYFMTMPCGILQENVEDIDEQSIV